MLAVDVGVSQLKCDRAFAGRSIYSMVFRPLKAVKHVPIICINLFGLDIL